MVKKYYAVKVGKTPGIYENWDECKEQVQGYPNAVYKSFSLYSDAVAFVGDRELSPEEGTDALVFPDVYAFVDGSYNIATKVYGYGGFLVHPNGREVLQGSGSDEEMAAMRNVAGEVLGSMAAISRAIELGLPEMTIYYDYMGIEMWATGAWKRNKQGTIAYYDYINSAKEHILLHFVKVRSHSGIAGNVEADRLAKEAVGNI